MRVMKAESRQPGSIWWLLVASSSDHQVRGKHLLCSSSELCRVPTQDRGKPRSLGRSEWAPVSRIVPGWISPRSCAPTTLLNSAGEAGAWVSCLRRHTALPHAGSPPHTGSPDLRSRQEATACYVLIYFLSQMGE